MTDGAAPLRPRRSSLAGRTAAGLAPELFGRSAPVAPPPASGEEPASRPPRARSTAPKPPRVREEGAFESAHAELFESLRTEIGAGTGNFVRACARMLPRGLAGVFEGVGLGEDGRWDAAALDSALSRLPEDRRREPLDALLRIERRMARRYLRNARRRSR